MFPTPLASCPPGEVEEDVEELNLENKENLDRRS